MDIYTSNWRDFIKYLYNIRDNDLNRLMYGNIADKEIHELRGGILSLNKVITRSEEILEEYYKNMNLPYNLRALKEEYSRFNINSHNVTQSHIDDQEDDEIFV